MQCACSQIDMSRLGCGLPESLTVAQSLGFFFGLVSPRYATSFFTYNSMELADGCLFGICS